MGGEDITLKGLSRRSVLAGTAGTALGAAAGASGRAAGLARRPNVVFIMADDLGYADVSCFGARDYRTPSVDALAARGLVLRNAYANSAVCSSTRTALITGRYQYRLPIGLEEPFAGPRSPKVGLPPDHPTLPSLLRAAGYRTGLIGKWHLGEPPAYGPTQSGYDLFWGSRGGAVDYFSHIDNGGRPDLWSGDTAVQKLGYMTELIGEQSVRAIDTFARANVPFLLSVHFTAPHWPWEGPSDEAESRRIGASLRHLDGGSRRKFGQMVVAMDQAIGRILAALRRAGADHNTIVVFTSDNGGERFSDTYPYTGQKTELLEGGLRVPAIISWPASLTANKVCEQVCISMDWMPTILAACGTVAAKGYPSDGIDLLHPFARQDDGRADPILALQSQLAEGHATRELQVSQDTRKHVPIRRRGRSDGTRQPQVAAAGRLQQYVRSMASVGRDDATVSRCKLYRGRHRRTAS